MDLTRQQRQELERAARTDRSARQRLKALTILNLAEGRKATELSTILRVSKQSIGAWRKRYLEGGLAGLEIRPGRGRKPRADLHEVEQYVHQSPRNFGVSRTRWTLATLAQTVPCLKGFTAFGVQQVLRRGGFHYKRGQPAPHSPDPDYSKKNVFWTKP